ncbi:MAG: hypothetical protein KC766_35495 [Myxococcales bacterium]|nr:hypothetical protein [Myxococcales bacterium]
MAENEVRRLLEELRAATTFAEAEAKLRTLLAGEAEACAGLMVAGGIEDIHDSILERAQRYRRMTAG